MLGEKCTNAYAYKAVAMKKNTKMRLFFVAIALLSGLTLSAQGKFFTKTGHIQFYSSTPLEEVKADNNQVVSYIDTDTGDFMVQMLVQSFKFPKALMEEHFNENYIESSKFPKAEFRGKITNLRDMNFSRDGTYIATIDGLMTIHGTTKRMNIKATIEVRGTRLLLTSKFKITPQDFRIKIGELISQKIAKSMDISVDMLFDPLLR